MTNYVNIYSCMTSAFTLKV